MKKTDQVKKIKLKTNKYMPKSRLRPNHKQKVAAWKLRKVHAERRYQRTMSELFEKMRNSMSENTEGSEGNESVQQAN